MEKPMENDDQECRDETSEDEWTYTKSDNVHWLVQNVEELVRDSPIKRSTSIQAPLNKISRVKEWLNMKRLDDSCDASGEDEQESQTSEEFNESIVTYRQAQSCESQNTSIIDLLVEQTPKVIKRGKLNSETRPWSVSCISQLAASPNSFHNPPKIFSTSESALYSLSKDFNEFPNSCGGLGNNSTSSTVEESSAIVLEEKCSPMRRKKFKLKKKCDYNKINHGALYHSTTLVKSGSFSGHPCVTSNNERHSVSDPSALYLCHFIHDSTPSGTESESESESKMRRMPNLKTRTKSSYLLSDIRSGSPVKNSILAAEEQSSSMSEQAWDGFQEDKYLSEPCESESNKYDSDAVRKLLEFGEDYGNYLGNQSDWSNQSTTFGFSPSLPRKCIKSIKVADSDSESQDMKYLLKEYSDQLAYTGRIYKNQLEMGLNDYVVSKDKDVLDTCNQYINSLHKTSVLDNPSKRSKEVSDLISNWHLLKERALKMQEYFDIQKDVLLLKNTLCDIKNKISANTLIFNSVDDLTRDIDFYTRELTDLQEQKKKLLAFNVSVHRFITTNKEYNSSFLKLDVPDLYRLWYDVHCSANDKIDQLNNLKQAWQMLESRLNQLRSDLRDDKLTLDVLEDALNSGTLTSHILSAFKDIEKLLSETQVQGYNIPELFLEGSCSDSGISDEGSEHEFGEREHRLTAIRRLVRQLETLMNPECVARVEMNESITAAEEELRNLQKRCRNIMTRSSNLDAFIQNRHLLSPDHAESSILTSKSSSWFNRVTRLSLPLQIALMTLLCVAYLL
ncbi:hypothetical protein AMK59_7016, partial [Oryctes borbonicus]